MQTKDQQYAAQAFEQVNQMLGESKDARDKYGSMAHRLPVLIRTAGLAQALGFIESRGTEAQVQLMRDISVVIGVPEIGRVSRQAKLPGYMKLTRDVMAALVWYKRFAASVLNVQADVDGEGAGD